jgi:alpha-tubulin suppressor-like RCC1 family protein
MQLGDGTLERRPTPVAVPGLAHVVELGAGQQNTCARTDDGAAWCWGVGYLSDPRHELKEDRTGHPRRIAGLAATTQLAVGQSHACAITRSGLTCWGYDHPMAPVPSLADLAAVSANWNNTCVLHGDGAIDCWGDNSRGQLGDGTLDDHPAPTRVLLSL